MFLLIYIITSSNLICSKSAHARIDILILLASLSAFPTATGAPLSLGQGSLLTLIPAKGTSAWAYKLHFLDRGDGLLKDTFINPRYLNNHRRDPGKPTGEATLMSKCAKTGCRRRGYFCSGYYCAYQYSS